jgi:hypothetical protein
MYPTVAKGAVQMNQPSVFQTLSAAADIYFATLPAERAFDAVRRELVCKAVDVSQRKYVVIFHLDAYGKVWKDYATL